MTNVRINLTMGQGTIAVTINYHCSPVFLFSRAHLFSRKMFTIFRNRKIDRVSFYTARISERTSLNFLLSEGICDVNVCGTRRCVSADDFEFTFLRVKLEPTGRELLIRNEKTTGFLVSRYSSNVKSRLSPECSKIISSIISQSSPTKVQITSEKFL